MKLTRILPKSLAKSWQEYDLNKIRSRLEYYRGMVRVLEQLEQEGTDELRRIQELKLPLMNTMKHYRKN